MVRWGILGASGVAHRRMMPAINMAQDNELRALMVRDIERARKLAQEHNARAYYDSVDDLISDPEVDAVHVATPVYLHCEHVIKSAVHGKHVLCEKPMAMNVDECRRMIEACEQNKVLLEVAFTLRFHPCFHKIRNIVNDGKLGKIVQARASLLKSYDIAEGLWRRNPSMSGGGVLMDMGVHAVDLLSFIFGDVSKVAMFANSNTKNWEVEETATLLLQMQNGANAVADVSFVVPYSDITLEIYGTEGTLLLYNGQGYQEYNLKLFVNNEVKEEFIPTQNLYKNLIEHFNRCLKGEEPPISPGIAGLKNIQIITSAYDSSSTGEIITISQC